MNRALTCDDCGGEGYIEVDHMRPNTCTKCGGSGAITPFPEPHMPSIIDAFPTADLIANARANATYDAVKDEAFTEVTLDGDLFDALLTRLALLDHKVQNAPH